MPRRHHHNGRWEARIGRVLGNKYLYLGTYGEHAFLPDENLFPSRESAWVIRKAAGWLVSLLDRCLS